MVLSLMALHWYWCSRCDALTSFVNAFNVTALFDATVTDGSFTASIGLFHNCSCSGIAFDGLTFNPVDGLARIIGR
jgi:hypothetical protein